jgi:hypothetical protein
MAPAPLGRHRAPGVVHQDLPHGSRGDGKEVDSVVVGLMSAVGELEVGLVNQGRGGERVAGPMSRELAVGPIV